MAERVQTNFYSLLFGQKFEGIPLLTEMPDRFTGQIKLVDVVKKIITDHEFWQREFSTLGYMDKNSQLAFTKIGKGDFPKPGQLLVVGKKPALLHQLEYLSNSHKEEFRKGNSRYGQAPIVCLHSHPALYCQYDAPFSENDLCSFLFQNKAMDGRIDFVSANTERFNPDWGDKKLPQLETVESIGRVSLFIKNQEYQEIAKRITQTAIKHLNFVYGNLANYLFDYDYQEGSAFEKLVWRLKGKEKTSPTVFSEVYSHLTALSRIFSLNGISSYVALFDEKSENIVFNQVPKDNLEELGQLEIDSNTGLLLPKFLLAKIQEDYFVNYGKYPWERSIQLANNWHK